MKLQENQRYTINEMRQYLTESAESKARKYCERLGISFDEIREKFPQYRVDNCKYLSTLCYIDRYNPLSVSDINKLNDILILCSYLPNISEKFTNTFYLKSEINDEDNNENKVINHFKKKGCKTIKFNDSILLYCIGGIWYAYGIKSHKDIGDFNISDSTIKYWMDKDKSRYNKSDAERMDRALDGLKNLKDIPNIIDIFDKFSLYSEEFNKYIKEKLNELPKENVGDYIIVPIYSLNGVISDEIPNYVQIDENNKITPIFDEIDEISGNIYPTYSRYYSKYTSWCVTTQNTMFSRFTKGSNAMFYFCLRKDWRNTKPNEDEEERRALDDYGTSMFAVSVNKDGEIKTIDSRWNHDYGGSDNVINPLKLSEYLGFNFLTIISYKNNEGKYKPKSKEYEIYERCGEYNVIKYDDDYFNILDSNNEPIFEEDLYVNIYNVFMGYRFFITDCDFGCNIYDADNNEWYDYVHDIDNITDEEFLKKYFGHCIYNISTNKHAYILTCDDDSDVCKETFVVDCKNKEIYTFDEYIEDITNIKEISEYNILCVFDYNSNCLIVNTTNFDNIFDNNDDIEVIKLNKIMYNPSNDLVEMNHKEGLLYLNRNKNVFNQFVKSDNENIYYLIYNFDGKSKYNVYNSKTNKSFFNGSNYREWFDGVLTDFKNGVAIFLKDEEQISYDYNGKLVNIDNKTKLHSKNKIKNQLEMDFNESIKYINNLNRRMKLL